MLTTSAELYARRAALDEAFFLLLSHPNPLAKLNELIAETEAARLAAFTAECTALHQLPTLADEDAASYHITYVVSAA